MPLEWIKPTEIKPADVSELEIQKAFEKHLGDLEEGLDHVDSFVRIPIGVMDSLGVDSERRPVIIEFKKPEGSDRDAIIQALDYYSWCTENIPWLNEFVKKQKPELLPSGQTLDEDIRLIVIAEEFEDRVRRACTGLEPECLLVKYELLGTPSGTKITHRIVLDTSATLKKAVLPKSIEEHFEGKEATRQIYDYLINEVKKFDPKIQPVPTQSYINLWTGVAGVIPRKKHLIIHARAKIEHPGFSSWNTWGPWGKPGQGGYMNIGSMKDLDSKVIDWIRRALETSKTAPT